MEKLVLVRPHPAIVLPRPTDRTKSVPNTGKYTGISRY
jgi:hypothetical protein